MLNDSWSWTGGGETYPKVTGKISYDPTRTTCTLPVKLEPGKVYWIGINSPSFRNFQNAANVPVRWYVILFATAGVDGKPTPLPEDLVKQAAGINARSGSPAAAVTQPGTQRGEPTREDKMAAENAAATGWRLWSEKKPAEAEAMFQKAVEKDPTAANSWNGLGLVAVEPG